MNIGLFPFPFFGTIIIIHIVSIYVTHPTINALIITICTFRSIKGVKKRKKSKYIFIDFGILILLFIISGSLHLLRWI